MTAITVRKLENLLRKTARCQFVSVSAVTDPDMVKRANRFGAARKVTVISSATINWSYRQRQRRLQIRSGLPATFRPKRRTWGKKLPQCPLVEYQSADAKRPKLYLELMVLPDRVSEFYFDPKTLRRIPTAKLQPFLKPRVGELRDYALSSIGEITIEGVRYHVNPAAAELAKYFARKRPADAPPSRSKRSERSGTTRSAQRPRSKSTPAKKRR